MSTSWRVDAMTHSEKQNLHAIAGISCLAPFLIFFFSPTHFWRECRSFVSTHVNILWFSLLLYFCLYVKRTIVITREKLHQNVSTHASIRRRPKFTLRGWPLRASVTTHQLPAYQLLPFAADWDWQLDSDDRMTHNALLSGHYKILTLPLTFLCH